MFPGIWKSGNPLLRLADIRDGASTTVGFAEVKVMWPYLAHGAEVPSASPASPPPTPAEVVAMGGQFLPVGSHLGWAFGMEEYTGLTFVFPPNTYVAYANPADGKTYDVDWVGGTRVGYGAINARSYHTGGVNTLFMDDSVRFVTNSIAQATWRALGTRNGGEAVVGPD